MTEKELTKKIIRNAKQQASDWVTAAEQRAAEQIASAHKQAEQRLTAALAKGQANIDFRKTQQQRAFEVARIKAQINAQQEWIDRAFAIAREKLLAASDQEIRVIVDHYTKKYAQPTDKILLAAAWSHALPMLPTTAVIQGGLIIENQTYRLEFDIDSILAELREPLAPTIAEMLGVL